MVRTLPLVLLPAALLVAGCERYEEPIAFAPHGAAVRANMAAQIVDPTPSMAPPGPMDAERALLGLDRYRTDTVEALGDVSTAPSVVVAPAQ
jgi:type IV pilus biogenesis protein CpaD/CtpE